MIPKELQALKQASEFTSFHEKISLLINPYLDSKWNIADFGCGLALVDFELASSVNSITAIDTDEEVLNEVDKKIDEELYKGNESAGKIKTLNSDTQNLPDDINWDAVLMLFYNLPYEELDALIERGSRRAIIILDGKSSNSKFNPSSENNNVITAPELEEHLTNKGYKFKKNIIDMEFGYPFKNLKDIQDFLSQFNADFEGEDIASNVNVKEDPDKLFAAAEERIIKTNRFDYPYYLPNSVSIGIFIIIK